MKQRLFYIALLAALCLWAILAVAPFYGLGESHPLIVTAAGMALGSLYTQKAYFVDGGSTPKSTIEPPTLCKHFNYHEIRSLGELLCWLCQDCDEQLWEEPVHPKGAVWSVNGEPKMWLESEQVPKRRAPRISSVRVRR